MSVSKPKVMRNNAIDLRHVWQIEGYVKEAKLKQAEIFDYKKRLAEAETRYRQQQNLLETARAERNLCNKSLVEAQEEIRDLKSKLKITNHQVEQLKEDVGTKEASLIKKEFRKPIQFNVSSDPLFVSPGLF